MMDTPPMGLLGVSACNDEEQWKYFIAVSTTKEKEDFEEYIVPASTWAIFPGEGTNQSVQYLEQRIVTEWLPTSGYEYANAPDIEVYLNPDPQNAKYEVWIPVVKKQEKQRSRKQNSQRNRKRIGKKQRRIFAITSTKTEPGKEGTADVEIFRPPFPCSSIFSFSACSAL